MCVVSRLTTNSHLDSVCARARSHTHACAEQALPHVLWELCSGPLPPIEALQCRQALAKQFAHILDFTLRFDEMKMCTPAVQNDFSYYRRTMNRDLHWMHHNSQLENEEFVDG